MPVSAGMVQIPLTQLASPSCSIAFYSMFSHRELLQYFIILQFEASPMTLFMCISRPAYFTTFGQDENRCRFLASSIVLLTRTEKYG